MALDFWWLEDRTATHQRVSFRVTADCTVGANGATVAIVAATADGTGYVDVPVSADAGSLAITVDGAQVDSGSYPAFALPGQSFAFAESSCQTMRWDFFPGHWLADKTDFLVHTGDWMYEYDVYVNGLRGEPGIADIRDAPTQAQYYAHHRQPYRAPGWSKYLHQRPLYKMENDHEWCDDFCGVDTGTTTTLIDNLLATEGGADRVAALATIRTRAENAIQAYRHQSKYYAFTYGDTRIIVINTTWDRTPHMDADGPDKKIIDDTQEAWLLAELGRSETFKIVCSGNGVFYASNVDGWTKWPGLTGYKTQLARILNYIKTQAITGVLWLTGDTHHPFVINVPPATVADLLGIGVEADYPWVCTVNSAGHGRMVEHDLSDAVGQPGFVWCRTGTGVPSDKIGDACITVTNCTPEYLQFEMWSISRKRLGWGRVYAGSNQMTEGRWA